MNAVEIEQAISDLAEKPFDPEEFPYAFLQAFGNKETTLKRLPAVAFAIPAIRTANEATALLTGSSGCTDPYGSPRGPHIASAQSDQK
jgi:hypothetical protein